MKIRLFLMAIILLNALNNFDCRTFAQAGVTFFTDAGKEVTSSGAYLRGSPVFSYTYKRNEVRAGGIIDILNNKDYNSTGFFLDYSRHFTISGKISLDGSAFFIYDHFSEVAHETNWGVRATLNRKHFIFKLGTNFRTFAYDRKILEEGGRIHENFNTMYAATGFIKPIDHSWNAGFCVTNFDHFIIEQETNPVMNIQAYYDFKKPVKIYTEFWFKSSGAFNLSVNPYGFFIRTGVLWKIKN